MNDNRIGIDTYGLSEPPDDEGWTEEEEARLNEIENKIMELVREYHKLTRSYPIIWGYKLNPNIRLA